MNVTYYNGDNVYGNGGQCTYDSTLTLPNNPSKTGYTFDGWQVRRASAHAQQCSLSDVDTSLTGSLAYGHGWYNNTDYCTYSNLPISCSENNVNDLLLNEWKTVFSYGVIKGEALCSSTDGLESNIPDETSTGKFCWCKVTDFIPYSNYKCNYSSSYWGIGRLIGNLGAVYGLAPDCDRYCAVACALTIQNGENSRLNMFELSGNSSVESNSAYQESTGGTVVKLIGYTNEVSCRPIVSKIKGITPSAAGTLIDSASPSTPQIITTAGSTGEAQDIKSLLEVKCGVGNAIITE